jgi:4-amino-4-deoxy-L-arabinose transferase-like glycosyltransferase
LPLAILSLLLAVLGIWILFFHRLADADLSRSHEARAAQDAQSILLSRNWLLPRLFDRHAELQKPPLYYWSVAAIAWLRETPVDAWAVRLPAALASLGGVLLLVAFGYLRGRPLLGLIAGAILATAQHYTWLARVGRIDMPLTLAVTVTLLGFYLAWCCRHEKAGRGMWKWLLLAYAGVAAGMLLKGPIAVVLPMAVAAMTLLLEGDLPRPLHYRAWLRLGHDYGLWWGIPVVLALTLPWYLQVNAETDGELFRTFFWKHNVERGLGDGALKAHPWWFYGPQLAFDFLPWSPLLPLLAWWSVRRGWWRSDPETRFGVIWMLTMLAVLSCAAFKRADYLLPLYPGAALFLAGTAERCYCEASFPRLWRAAFALVLVGAVGAWWGYVSYVLPRSERVNESTQFAQEIRRHAPAPELVIFFRAEAHALAFHVGQPVDTILEWENLDVWAGYPQSYHVVMPPECADEWPQHLKSGRLEMVLSSSECAPGPQARPLVLMRTVPGPTAR